MNFVFKNLLKSDQINFGYSLIILLIVGIVHRAFLFTHYFSNLNDLIMANHGWLAWQYLTIDAFKDHFTRSMLYLQQTPPIPNMIFGFAIKLFGWPFGTTYFLIIFQFLISIVSSGVMLYILTHFYKKLYVNLLIVMAFLFSTDIVIMEYNAFGQTFYENFSMLLLLIIVLAFIKLKESDELIYSILLGLCTAVLALTRAAYSYFFIIPFIFLLFMKLSRKRIHICNFFAAVILLHGGWVVKNLIVYGKFSLETSSWSGINSAFGLVKAGMGEAFKKVTLWEGEYYPAWFIKIIEKNGIVHWNYYEYRSLMPSAILEREDEIQRLLGNTNSPTNSIGVSTISNIYKTAYFRFVTITPSHLLRKFYRAYILWWEPIRNYGCQYLDLFVVNPFISNSFRFDLIIKGLFENKLFEKQYVVKGSMNSKKYELINLVTIPYIPLVILMVNIVVLHLIIPLILIYNSIMYLLKKKNKYISSENIFIFVTYIYAILVFNIPEIGENMRFRLTIEPLIWILSFFILVHFLPSLVKSIFSYHGFSK